MARPIKRFTEITNEIAEGNLDKQVDIKSKDEIGNLASSFNRMTYELKKSRKEIEKYSRGLESKVKDRTKELQSKNEELAKFNKLAVGRELKMIELKKRIKQLEEKPQNK